MLVDYKQIIEQFTNQKYIAIAGVIYILFWVYAILRVAKDITARTKSNRIRFLSLLIIGATGPIGLPAYWLIRPVGYIYQKNTSISIDEINCGYCNNKNDINNDFCIFCGSSIKLQCKECKNLFPSNYQYCCKCGAPNISIK